MTVAALALFAVGGLAVDAGHAYTDRRALQSAADTAADTGMRLLLLDYHNQSSMPYSDSAIQTQVGNMVNAATTASSGLTSYTAWYVDETGAHEGAKFGTAHTLNICTTAGQTGCDAGVEVDPTYTHKTLLLGAVGIPNATEAAKSTALYTLTGTPFYLGPWSVWHQSCDDSKGDESSSTDTDSLVVGDTVTFTSSKWLKNEPTCGTGNLSHSSSYKGFITSCTSLPCSFNYDTGCPSPPYTVTNSGSTNSLSPNDCINTRGGDHSGQQPDLASMSNNYTTAVLMPIISYIGDQGGDYELGIGGFVSVIPNSDGSDGIITKLCYNETSAQCLSAGGGVTVTSGFQY